MLPLSTGVFKFNDLSSILIFEGGGLGYAFSYGIIKSAGSTLEGSASPRTSDSRSIVVLPHILAFLPVRARSTVMVST